MFRTTAAHEELQAVVGRALVDPSFCTGLLNGHRAECLAEFELTDDQMRAARSIRASDLSSFAAELDRWITRQTTDRRIALAPISQRELPQSFAAAA